METSGGWIKLYRSLVGRGHLQMPDKAFKLFIFILLQVNHSPQGGCAAGEGWITYQMIQDNCCPEGESVWSRHTISESLNYLEANAYIRRVKTKAGAPQRIRVINWDKYQGQSGAPTSAVTSAVTGSIGELVENLSTPEGAHDKGQRQSGSVTEQPTAPVRELVTAPPTALKQEDPRMLRREAGAEQSQPPASTFDQERDLAPAPAALVNELHPILREQLGGRCPPLTQLQELLRNFGEKRIRFAIARVAEERKRWQEGDREAMGNPKALFFGILRSSTEEEADAHFADQAAGAGGDPARPLYPWEVEDPHDRIRRERQAAMAGYVVNARPKSTDEID